MVNEGYSVSLVLLDVVDSTKGLVQRVLNS